MFRVFTNFFKLVFLPLFNSLISSPLLFRAPGVVRYLKVARASIRSSLSSLRAVTNNFVQEFRCMLQAVAGAFYCCGIISIIDFCNCLLFGSQWLIAVLSLCFAVFCEISIVLNDYSSVVVTEFCFKAFFPQLHDEPEVEVSKLRCRSASLTHAGRHFGTLLAQNHLGMP